MDSGVLLAPALSRPSSSRELCLQPTQDLFPGLSIRTEKNRCLFFSSLNLEKVGSFLFHFCVALELVSRLSNCVFRSNLLSSLPSSFFFLFFFSCCFIDNVAHTCLLTVVI